MDIGNLKVRVHSHRRRVLLSVIPIFFPATGSGLQSSRVKGVIRKMEVTWVAIVEVGWQTVHEFCDGSVKLQLNKVSKSCSNLKCHLCSLPNEREGILVIEF